MTLSKKEIGNIGEEYACNYLVRRGYTIICRNYHSIYGEIDIIANFENYIDFIEVKARKINSAVKGAEAVNYNKQKKIINTAQSYIIKNNIKLQPRYSIFEITFSNTYDNVKIINCNYYENAFDTTGILF